jgi:hypothetical protein
LGSSCGVNVHRLIRIVEIGADAATSTTSATTDQLIITTNGNLSKPITGETRYTLSCIDLSGTTQTKTATVRIIPVWQER